MAIDTQVKSFLHELIDCRKGSAIFRRKALQYFRDNQILNEACEIKWGALSDLLDQTGCNDLVSFLLRVDEACKEKTATRQMSAMEELKIVFHNPKMKRSLSTDYVPGPYELSGDELYKTYGPLQKEAMDLPEIVVHEGEELLLARCYEKLKSLFSNDVPLDSNSKRAMINYYLMIGRIRPEHVGYEPTC